MGQSLRDLYAESYGMSMMKPSGKKQPSQNPVDFFKGKQQGGTHGASSKVPDMLSGGPMREKMPGGKK